MRIVALLLVWTLFSCVSTKVYGLKEFTKPFEQQYLADGQHSDDVRKVFRKAKCNICHVKGEKKEINNLYGDAIDELIQGNAKERLKTAKELGNRDEELERVLEEFIVALKQVESLDGPRGITYRQRIMAGKLPIDLPPEKDDKTATEVGPQP